MGCDGQEKYSISKHRMLLFISGSPALNRPEVIISKHRMLLFIIRICHRLELLLDFKTSYVTVYPCSKQISRMEVQFQNIVCYCLSSAHEYWSAINTNFKTSYVTVYHRIPSPQGLTGMHFKTSYVTVYRYSSFIACFHASNFKTSYVTVYLALVVLWFRQNWNFKTSYVTVYLGVPPVQFRRRYYFKTSYVTVYPTSSISLFWILLFQNIVCYCLSRSTTMI